MITEKRYKSLFKSLSRNVIVDLAYIPDEETFKYAADLKQQNRLAFIGEINYHWQHKRLDTIAGIMNQLSDTFECSIVGQGNGMKDF